MVINVFLWRLKTLSTLYYSLTIHICTFVRHPFKYFAYFYWFFNLFLIKYRSSFYDIDSSALSDMFYKYFCLVSGLLTHLLYLLISRRLRILVSLAPYKDINPIHEGSLSWCNHFLKAPSPNGRTQIFKVHHTTNLKNPVLCFLLVMLEFQLLILHL